jgi:phospholipid/cholesterol/gamma-HCH transport system substrate-binding protein
MRRLVYIALFVAIVPWIVIGIVRSATNDETKDHYQVRAIFDNASSLVKGEDVKIAGVPVGVVKGMDVTDDEKAAITLQINKKEFTPFKADAHCTIRPQGLIGEKFVECTPGSASSPALHKIEHGDGKGARLLPVQGTSSPVDLDLVNDIMRLPYRERFAILLNELGTGLAGNGADLNEVIHRANPALKETDQVLEILGNQNRVLARLARDSDTALAPLAREREHFADFIVQANNTGEATAERSADIRLGIHRLPEFLRQLRGLMVDLEGLADQGTPLLTDVNQAAPALGRLIKAQGTLADASRESFPSLGDALERGRPALIRSRPLIRQLASLGKQLNPTSKNLDALTASLQKTGGVERINDFQFYVPLAINGFDSLGHYLRAGLVANTCTNYVAENGGPTCNSNFFDPSDAPQASKASSAQSTAPKQPKSSTGGADQGGVPPTGTLLQGLLGSDDGASEQRKAAMSRLGRQARSPSRGLQADEPMLDYLLGGQSR